MRASALAVVSTLLAATGCAKSGESKPVAKATKRERCEAIAGQAAQSAGLAIGLMASSMAEDGKGLSGEELSAGTRDMKAELLAECMTWDDEVLDCFKPFAMLGDKCERVLAEALGQTVAPDDAPEGPAPKWTLELPGTVRQLEADDAGRVLVRTDDALLGIVEGKLAWTVNDVHDRFVLGPGDTVAIARDHALIGLSNVDGTETFRAEMPLDGEDPEYAERTRPGTFVPRGEDWLVGDDEGRFVAVRPRACTDPPKLECSELLGALPEEYFDSGSILQPLPDGGLLLWEDASLRGLDAQFRVRFDAVGLDSLDAVQLHGDGKVTAMIDHDIVRLDPIKCRAVRPFAPSSFPQKGRMYFADDAACEDCGAVPPGCVESRVYVQDYSPDAMAITTDGTVAVDSWNGVIGYAQGKRRWGHELLAAAGPVAVGDDVLVVGRDEEHNAAAFLWRVRADGSIVARSKLTGAPNGDVTDYAELPELVVAGELAIVVVDRTMLAVPL